MNFLGLSIGLIAIFATVFATDRGATALATSPTAFLSVFAIFAAAVLVRLNRGIPSVEWKLVEDDALKRLMDRMEEVAHDYVTVLLVIFGGMVSAIAILIVGDNFDLGRVEITQILSGICGGFFGLSISRMAHLVWLDVSIFKLQRTVIESSAQTKTVAGHTLVAAAKLEEMSNAIRERGDFEK